MQGRGKPLLGHGVGCSSNEKPTYIVLRRSILHVNVVCGHGWLGVDDWRIVDDNKKGKLKRMTEG